MSKLGRILLGLCAVGALLLAPSLRRRAAQPLTGTQAEAQTASDTSDGFKRVWATPVTGFRDAAVSPDGSYVGILSDYAPGKRSEKVALWHWADRPLKPLWSRAESEASLVAVSAEGRTVLSCAQLNPLQRLVSIRKGADGARMCSVQTATVKGAIWDVQLSADGQYAGITTGDGGLYRVKLGYGETTPTFARWPLDGIGNSVDLTTRNTYIAAGTWDQTGVSCYALKGDGTPTWQFPNERTTKETRQTLDHRLFEAQFTGNGRFVLGLSYANARQSDGTLYLWRSDGDGTPLWRHELGLNTFFPKALVSQDGQTIVVSYMRMIAQGSRTVPERSLLVLNGDGQVLWEKGGLWFSPTLVAMAPDGHRLTVSDGGRMLYNVNSSGRITTPYQFKGPATIRQTVSTPDGRVILVYTSDGWLHLVQIG